MFKLKSAARRFITEKKAEGFLDVARASVRAER